MKIVVAVQGTTPDSVVDTRLGRGAYFLVFDSESSQWEPATILNEAAYAGEDAGVEVAKSIADAGAQAAIASHCGRRAFSALQDAGVKVYPAGGLTADEAVEALLGGQLEPFTDPDLCSMSEKTGHVSPG